MNYAHEGYVDGTLRLTECRALSESPISHPYVLFKRKLEHTAGPGELYIGRLPTNELAETALVTCAIRFNSAIEACMFGELNNLGDWRVGRR